MAGPVRSNCLDHYLCPREKDPSLVLFGYSLHHKEYVENEISSDCTRFSKSGAMKFIVCLVFNIPGNKVVVHRMALIPRMVQDRAGFCTTSLWCEVHTCILLSLSTKNLARCGNPRQQGKSRSRIYIACMRFDGGCRKFTVAQSKRRTSDRLNVNKDEDLTAMQASYFFVDAEDILSHTISFVGDAEYLFVASVSKAWKDAWGPRPKTTSRCMAVQSCSCLAWAMASDFGRNDGACRRAASKGLLDVIQYAIELGCSRDRAEVCMYAAGGGHLESLKWCRARGCLWKDSLRLAMTNGHLEVVRWCLANGCPWDTRWLQCAAQMGHFEVLAWCRANGYWTSQVDVLCAISVAAAGGGHQEVVRWCVDNDSPWSAKMCSSAAMGGHFELLKWLRAKDCPWDAMTCMRAVTAGHLEMLQWCRANDCPWHLSICRSAALRGLLHILQWCIANGCPTDHDTIYSAAAEEGHLDVIKWCRAMGYSWSPSVCSIAASQGHLEVVKWCITNGCPWGTNTFPSAGIFCADLDMLKWAKSRGCPWISEHDYSTYFIGGAKGSLELLQWWKSQSYPWNDEFISHGAGRYGHLNVLAWLHEQGCHLNETICVIAAMNGFLDILKWWRANQYAWHEATCAAAAYGGGLEVLQWCRVNGCPWDEGTCRLAARNGDLAMLKWCKANDCPWDVLTCAAAAKECRLDVLQWCRTNGCPWDGLTYKAAADNDDLEMLEWCSKNGCPSEVLLSTEVGSMAPWL